MNNALYYASGMFMGMGVLGISSFGRIWGWCVFVSFVILAAAYITELSMKYNPPPKGE